MNIALIVNPQAGNRCGIAAADAAEAVLTGGGWHVTRMITQDDGHATELARDAAGRGFDAVFACGGDGTLSQVVGGLLDSDVIAGIIPTGTGNDVARCIGLSIEPAQAARQALTGHDSRVDLLEINGGEHWSINVTGVGFDAGVAERINRRRRLTTGRLAYLTAVAQELFRHQPLQARLRVDGEEWEGEALLVAIANTKSYGAGMMIAPRAEVADGLLDVVLVKYVSRLTLIRSFPRVLSGTHEDHPAVTMWQATEAHLETPEPAPALVDGELLRTSCVHARIAPKRARLWLPGGLAPVRQELVLQPSVEG